MTLAYDFTRAGTLSIIAVLVHFISVELFQPSGVLYSTAVDGTSVIGGPAKAAFWFEILAVWVPLMVFMFAWVWVMIRQYRRQTATAAQRVR